MRWSWRIGRVAGIGLFVHFTFPLLIFWAGFSQYLARRDWADAALGAGLTLVLFTIVVLHELGHALTARRFGIRTRDITLLPIGGVARLERMPEKPREELLVALAGPAVNVGLAVLFFALSGGGRGVAELTEIPLHLHDVLTLLMWVNVVLALFNLLPAFPMDGGRVLRALLATRLSYARATRVAATIGQAMALVFAFFGLSFFLFASFRDFSNPFLLLIAAFVWMGASQEAGLVELRSALGGVTLGELMVTNFRSLSPEDPLSRAIASLLSGWQQDFPVLADGRLVGLLTRAGLLQALVDHGSQFRVSDAMQVRFAVFAPEDRADAVLVRLRNETQTVLVARNGNLVGMVTAANVTDYLTVHAALARGGGVEIVPEAKQAS